MQSSETIDSGASASASPSPSAPPLARSHKLTRESADGHTTVLSPPQASNNQVIISHPLHTLTTRPRTSHGGETRTMPGSAATVLPRARIRVHTHTTNINTILTPVRRHRHHRRHMPRAILTLAGRHRAAHLTTACHVRSGKRRSWTVSIASLDLRGQCNLSDSSSLSLSLALWGKVERKQRCHPFHTR